MRGFLPLLLAPSLAWAQGVQLDPEARPAPWLSEYGLFADGLEQVPAEGVLPYDVRTPLFSDYAFKRRFVYLPPGTTMTYRDPEVLELPVGAAVLKSFGYPDAEGREHVLETRLLIRRAQGWVGYPYVWDHERGDARLKLAGATLEVERIVEGRVESLRYLVPNANDCRKCHVLDGSLDLIGLTARNVAGDALAVWEQAGLLEGAPADERPRLPVWDDPQTGDLDARARAYLEVNCAHCHRPGGAGATSGLDLRASHQDPYLLGIRKPPVAAGRGSGGLEFDVVPGEPEASILVLRMLSTDPGVQMPELGRRLIHTEGLELIRAWIKGLK